MACWWRCRKWSGMFIWSVSDVAFSGKNHLIVVIFLVGAW